MLLLLEIIYTGWIIDTVHNTLIIMIMIIVILLLLMMCPILKNVLSDSF